MFDGELLEVLRLDVAVVLWVWMCKDEWLEIHSLGRAVAEEDVKAHVSCIFSPYDVKSCGSHCYFTFHSNTAGTFESDMRPKSFEPILSQLTLNDSLMCLVVEQNDHAYHPQYSALLKRDKLFKALSTTEPAPSYTTDSPLQ